MYLDNLSVAILRVCEKRHLTYEMASECCDMCTPHLSRIIRRVNAPRLPTLEKICTGLDLTPNDLLLPLEKPRKYSQDEPRIVIVELNCGPNGQLIGVPVCPRCGKAVEWKKQFSCAYCNQKLDWTHLEGITFRLSQ